MSFHKYESLNYVEETSHARSANPLWRFDQYNHPREIPRRRTLAKWIITFILGTTMAFTSLAMAAASTNIQGVKLWFIFNAFGTASLPTLTSIFLCFAASNLLFSLLATAIVMIAGRGVSQSTVFEVVCYLNGVDMPGFLSVRTIFAKVLGSTLALSGNLLVGMDGPLLHVGGSIAAVFGNANGSKWWRELKLLRYFRDDKSRRDLVTYGTAAGFTAAFGSPVAGFLYALEISSWWRVEMTWRAFVTCAITGAVIHAVARICHKDAAFGYFTGDLWQFPNVDYSTDEDPMLLLAQTAVLGLLAGLLGAAYIKLNAKRRAWQTRRFGARLGPRVMETMLISLMTSAAFLYFPYLHSIGCKECSDDHATSPDCVPGSAKFAQFATRLCHDPRHYNDLAVLFFNPQGESLKALLASTNGDFRAPTLLLFSGVYIVLSLISHGMAVPSGVIIPSLLAGAGGGRLYGRALRRLALGSQSPNEALFALLGAAAYSGGIMRSLPCLCIMLLEVTGQIHQFHLVLLVLLVSKSVADRLSDSLSKSEMRGERVPMLPVTAPPSFHRGPLSATTARSGSPSANARQRPGQRAATPDRDSGRRQRPGTSRDGGRTANATATRDSERDSDPGQRATARPRTRHATATQDSER
ncbi:hypothetical protein CYMTET_49377 [Cymbomonas tetramitiformis]|uniref:Chloride channel protein n=1 Tax=Cymbomonas tetramitiformis TaxID=36881 RepID=A0AAE0BS02_9CHLO|nr:hypothetical protein CYMTET_49377 [Cymbomonas tetramitiformis]